jgi:hypothetical protein
MKKQYVFGYLFVRFAKLISALVVLAALGACALHTFGHLNTLDSLSYTRDYNLNSALDTLTGELSFVRKEAGKFGYTDDGKTIDLSPAPSSLPQFARSDEELKQVQQRVALVKKSVTAGFVEKATELRNRIRTAIDAIEKLRAAGETNPPVPEQPKTPSRPVPLNPMAPLAPQKTLFGIANDSANENSRNQLAQWSLFFKKLHSDAEKQENKELIDSLLAEFEKLRALFPEAAKPVASAPPTQRTEDPSKARPTESKPPPPEDPLVTALSNIRTIESAIAEVLELAQGRWTIDGQLDSARQMLQNEKAKCVALQTARVAAWVSWAKQIGLSLVSGAVTAFFILVFADFIQSFFDTSVNTRRTATLLDPHKEDSA